jgi:putative transposase
MPRRARVKSRSGIYHIMLRGANRQEIFHDDEDCRTFLEIFYKYKLISNIRVYSWCLMNNHVHLLIKEGEEDISITMKRIEVSFVLYYNRKYRTTGHLFQDRFRSENVEDYHYLFTVIRYIHQNPLKARMVNRNDQWQWSSCREYYCMKQKPGKLTDLQSILELFAEDPILARERFIEFNEKVNQDQCLDDTGYERGYTDEEARKLIKQQLLNGVEIAQVKSLPRDSRNEILRKAKEIKGISQRQLARILGVSRTLLSKA